MTGGAFGSMIAQLFKLTAAERKTLLVAGAAAGMSATFAAPIASVAPKGPPDPIDTAEERGLRSATFGSTRLPRVRMASSASGIPWPRMRSLP